MLVVSDYKKTLGFGFFIPVYKVTLFHLSFSTTSSSMSLSWPEARSLGFL